MPYNVMLIGLIVVCIWAKQRRVKVGLALIFLGLYLQSNGYLVGRLYELWEVPFQEDKLAGRQYDFGIVLSGGLVNSCTSAREFIDLERGSDRLLTAYFLYRKGVCRKLLISGTDDDDLLAENRGEVQLARALLVEWGVPEEDILLETEARNTYENALFVARFLKETPLPRQNLLLITSAYHMRRALGCFEKAGLRVEAFPADFHPGKDCLPFRRQMTPSPKASESFQKLWREWVGMLMYKMVGYC